MNAGRALLNIPPKEGRDAEIRAGTVVVGGGAAGIGAAAAAQAADPSGEVIVYTEFEDSAYSPCGIPYVHGKEIPNSNASSWPARSPTSRPGSTSGTTPRSRASMSPAAR